MKPRFLHLDFSREQSKFEVVCASVIFQDFIYFWSKNYIGPELCLLLQVLEANLLLPDEKGPQLIYPLFKLHVLHNFIY